METENSISKILADAPPQNGEKVEELLQLLQTCQARLIDPGQWVEQLKFFADLCPSMIWTSGPDKCCVYVNKAWLEFTGHTLAQEVGSAWSEGIHPEDLSRCEQIYSASFEARKEFKTEYRLRRGDGEYRWIYDQGRPWNLPNGEFGGFIGSCVDMSDRFQLEARLRQSQKMEALGQLAAGVAHDFNNILTIIQGHTNLLLNQLSLDRSVINPLQEVALAAERAAGLTRQLLTFSRRQLTLQLQPLSINEVIRSMMKLLERLIGDQVEIECDLWEPSPVIKGDVGMIEQVVMNLAVNARDAMGKGGSLLLQTRRVELDANAIGKNSEARAGAFARLSVSDTGSGMDNATLVRIFEPFFTTKETGKGTGLGLSTVYGIVKMHQGWIEVDSTLGKGTSFKIFFPLNEVTHATAPEDQPRCTIQRGHETILVVEDDVVLRGLVRQILEFYGYQVLEAGSGREAIKVWEDYPEKIDLLLTDLMMPGGISGKQLKEKLQERNPQLQVICTSGYSPDMAGESIERLGFKFLPKPYHPEALAAAVRRALDREETSFIQAPSSRG